jgi:hypothetical protein
LPRKFQYISQTATPKTIPLKYTHASSDNKYTAVGKQWLNVKIWSILVGPVMLCKECIFQELMLMDSGYHTNTEQTSNYGIVI